MNFSRDFAMMVSITCNAKGEQRRGGMVLANGKYVMIRDAKIQSEYDTNQNQTMMKVWAKTDEREYEVTGTRIEERGKRTDELIEAVLLLLSRPNATFHGRYYRFDDVTIDYVSSMQGSGFTFKNPNATGGCGCGSSFSA